MFIVVNLRHTQQLFSRSPQSTQFHNQSKDHIRNLQRRCSRCIRNKGGRPMEEFLEAKKAGLRESLKLLDGLNS